ncbi:unnamed protein product [Acanthoscelides obtectus]|uniref:Uncharacterized protein n=1 Tax=Acanthoscelides obtectus TaxID=200917 RepID=A0A9P0K328_ACAOB|nr:unnamed protein product [Acanthoscelides obtectus]CAK1631456.1 hypothetical protein AOBTE_LOCUS6959 [Acanthoscelides obtectus]
MYSPPLYEAVDDFLLVYICHMLKLGKDAALDASRLSGIRSTNMQCQCAISFEIGRQLGSRKKKMALSNFGYSCLSYETVGFSKFPISTFVRFVKTARNNSLYDF